MSEAPNKITFGTFLHIVEILIILFGGAVAYGQLVERVDAMDKNHSAQMESLNQRLTRFEGYIDKAIELDGKR